MKQIKRSIVFGVLFILLAGGAVTRMAAQEERAADSVSFGLYIIDIYNLKMQDNELAIDFYPFFCYRNSNTDPAAFMEIVNAKEFEKSGEYFEEKSSCFYQTMKVKSVIKKNWDVAKFPFDKHTVEIVIEDIARDVTKVVFIPDATNSTIDKKVKIAGWDILGSRVEVVTNMWESTYGDPDIAPGDFAKYSRFIFSFDLQRADGGWGTFLKTFVGLFIAVMIAFVTLFVRPEDLDPRFGLSVGALFAALASQYVISSVLPETPTQTLVDILHNVSYVFIFLCVGESAMSLKIYMSETVVNAKKKALLMDKIAAAIMIPLYFGIVVASVWQALS